MMTIQKSQKFTSLTPVVLLFAQIFFLPSSTSYGQAIQIVAPNGLENSSGSELGRAPTTPTRVQWLYDAEYFASDGIIEISSLAWRADESQTSPFSSTDNDISISLSTTEVSSLTSRYERNVGADQLQVFSGSFTLSRDSGMQSTDFLQPFEFATPFRYDPSAGNLLVDTMISGFSDAWLIDNHEFFDGKIRLIVGDANAGSARNLWHLVAVTQFTAVPVPEPTGLSIAAIAGSIIPFARRHRKRRIVCQS